MSETGTKFRSVYGVARAIERGLLVTLTLVGGLWATHLHDRLRWAFFKEQYLGLFLTVVTASLGVILLGVGCAGYLFRPLSWIRRAWACGAGLLLFAPPIAALPLGGLRHLPATASEIVADALGLALAVALVIVERTATAARRPAAAAVPEAQETA